MRRVPLPPTPTALRGAGSRGEREIERAKKYYAAKPCPTKTFKHAIYKDPTVRDALNQAFEYKCAYCESNYGATQPVDVEHYRPKGEVVDDDGVTVRWPGYYWLAATWDNLVPSCIDCNRVRHHVGRDGVSRAFGKGCRFPLIDEGARAGGPTSDISRELPLLLNPYLDHPETHLDFHESGAVRPAPGPPGSAGEDPRGRATIDVAGLNRPRLAEMRAAHARLVAVQLARVADAEHNIRRAPTDEVFIRQLKRELEALRDMQRPDAPYPTMTRQLIKAYKQRSLATR